MIDVTAPLLAWEVGRCLGLEGSERVLQTWFHFSAPPTIVVGVIVSSEQINESETPGISFDRINRAPVKGET